MDDLDMAGIPSVRLYLDMFSLDTIDRHFSAGKCLVDIFLKERESSLFNLKFAIYFKTFGGFLYYGSCWWMR